ncbi:LPS export ABC transporter periplasmic protein LptC [Phaeobacter gallaeciensis]|uniref:LPS export ABC transporter periplasmic protein LptC n=1 Tax=Phaeobacter gallaeciensis TaxID=60890 RepID=UPI00237F64E3|nr:LPS export ABC transporter periplasmic protein LptC [Phaeobacter gallaeciensis]MDE4062455.1 LPS export ABC transporter periplasmic protein LptC [Phaeobacter gallaeciensis]MDE4125314.1 LPS export ABC transporter periplasmic protein LptC [Phaeobacter gallaeciensis]MDE4129794.1 LPS export ABC transporter periplasmic protein LptC [Phaeobacter gallaeciensis]
MDRYSRTVAYLKVLLPLAALALLSTLFLISRGVDTEAVIPFAQKEIEERMRGQQVTRPFFSGTTAQGDEIMVMASVAQPNSGSGGATATNLQAEIRMAEGGRMTLVSDSGAVHPDQGLARFSGNVKLTSADGMTVETELLETALDGVRAESPGPVHATGALGVLTAGQMLVTAKTEGGPVQMVFKNRVKLVYDPNTKER